MKAYQRFGKTLGQLLFQLIPVAVGVYIGILAGNWNDARHAKATQNQFLKTLCLELDENRKLLEGAAEYHEILGQRIDSIREIASEDDMNLSVLGSGSFGSFIEGWRGIMIPSLERSIYDTGILANALVGLDFATINRISKVYNLQESYRTFAAPILERLLNMDLNTTRKEALLILSFITTDLNQMEFSLIQSYEQLMEYLKNH
ncbi:MAG: hypothetical protein AAF433_20710 [Bacteroidota bacterium]